MVVSAFIAALSLTEYVLGVVQAENTVIPVAVKGGFRTRL